ncbi:Uncharacterized protein FWK35_00019178 [Aphis craccivora]|uniref:Uncharacterized protein n=1 Tax=Aphis craccivora TaxID=307492 RepID=A0A6G0Z2X4_APHCR|nr:Uncharacterized protein FWK35_00019178 [Aphis craccivora]
MMVICARPETVVSPHLALLDRVHVGTQRTPEVVAEIFQVGERSDDPETAWRVEAGSDAVLECFRSVLGAPHVGGTYPEHLLRCVVLESWQSGFDAVSFGPHVVRVVRLLHATVVGDVLALRVDAVQLRKTSR